MSYIPELIESLDAEIDYLKHHYRGNIITLYNGEFLRQSLDLYFYKFTTENFLVVLDDTPAEIEIKKHNYDCNIISIEGQNVQISINSKIADHISIARLKIENWRLLEKLKEKFEANSNGKSFEFSEKLFSKSLPRQSNIYKPDYTSHNSLEVANPAQSEAINSSINKPLCIIWGPPGTGKTSTIAKAAESHLNLGRKVLLVSHANNAVDQALERIAKQTFETFYEKGSVIRLGTPKAEKLKNLEEKYPLVLPDKIVEAKSKQLQIEKTRYDHELREVKLKLNERLIQKALLREKNNISSTLSDIKGTFTKNNNDIEGIRREYKEVKSKIERLKVKYTKSQEAVFFKKIFLNQEKIQSNISKLESDKSSLKNRYDSYAVKQKELIEIFNNYKLRLKEIISALTKEGINEKNEHSINSEIKRLSELEQDINSKVNEISQRLEQVKKEIFQNAKLIATTLTKTYTSQEIDKLDFDVMVLDEASMAPLPIVYWAASKIGEYATIVGDFLQLPPISHSTNEMAKKWLKSNIFNLLGYDTVNKANSDKVNLLNIQYRMHPLISEIPRKYIYENKLKDAESTNEHSIRDGVSGSHSLCLIDTKIHNPWCSQLDRGSRFNLLNALLDVSLLERIIKDLKDDETIGVIAPYRPQATLIYKIAEERGLLKYNEIMINTIHSFQGGEESIIIFDTVEGDGAKQWSSINEYQNTENAKLLLNVAITRSKSKLYLIGNTEILKKRFKEDTILMKLLDHIAMNGTVIQSTSFFPSMKNEHFDYWIEKVNNLNSRPFTDGNIFDEDDFWPNFINDLSQCKEEVIIFSPFISSLRASKLVNIFIELINKGIKIYVITRIPTQQPSSMKEDAKKVISYLKSLNIVIKFRDKMHEKIALIDRTIKWVGSLNILSHNNSTEHMERFVSQMLAQEIYEKFELEKYFNEYTLMGEVCPGCKSNFITIRRQKKNRNNVFYSCSGYPDCKWTKSI
jgi:superfamily I DNA and/or RNA helicase